MADLQTGPGPVLEKTSSSVPKKDSVFLVENTDIDLGTLFASIDKKTPDPESEVPTESIDSTHKAPALGTTPEPSEAIAHEGTSSRKKGRMVLALVGLVFAAAGAVTAHRYLIQPAPQIAQKHSGMIRHSIIIPRAEERMELFFTAQSKEKEDFLSMTLIVRASRPDAEGALATMRVVLRDAAYGFLSQQHPEKNVRRFWSPIVERDLLTDLQRRFPQAGIVAVELEDLQKI